MRRSALLASLVAGCYGPFHCGTYDNRPPEDPTVTEVSDDGTVMLDDGRALRLSDREPKAVRAARGLLAGERVQVGVSELKVWKSAQYCGLGQQTWNPFAEPSPAYPFVERIAIEP